MSDNIIDLDFHRFNPHIGGDARCLTCGHEWQAIAPIGTTELECPSCHTWKGVFIGFAAPDEVWQCDCGNQHFYISHEGAMCARCGVRQRF